MDPYSGLVDLFEKQGVMVQSGNRLKYIDSKGKEHLEYRKDWDGDKLTMIMNDYLNVKQPEPKEESEKETKKEKK
jgi:hypothetical protein